MSNRKRKYPTDYDPTHICIRINIKEREALDVVKVKEQRTITQYVRLAIVRALKDDGVLPEEYTALR